MYEKFCKISNSIAHKENKLSEDTKKKISDGLKKYYSQNENNKVNIEKHQESMTRAVGKPVAQYTKDGVFIKEYKSKQKQVAHLQ